MKKAISKVSTFIKMMTGTATEKKNEKMVFAKDLPMAIKLFVQRNFSCRSIAMAEMKSTAKGIVYVVYLNDGIQLVFNENGGWEMVDCKMGVIPTALVPANIISFMDVYYPCTPLVKMEKIDDGYEVTLSNYSTLQFDKMGYVA